MTEPEAEKMLADWTEPVGALEITRTTTKIMMQQAYAKGVKDTEERLKGERDDQG